MSLINILKETYSRQPLYHFTPLPYLYRILKDNRLEVLMDNHISLTRKYDLSLEFEHFGDARITFDTDKLRNRYSIEQYDWSIEHIGYDRRKEAEERIKAKEIPNIDRYILRIDILSDQESNQHYENPVDIYDPHQLDDYVDREIFINHPNPKQYLIDLVKEQTSKKVVVTNRWMPYKV